MGAVSRPGLTFDQLAERAAVPHDRAGEATLAFILRDEQRRGRVTFESDPYALNGGLDAETVVALRRLSVTGDGVAVYEDDLDEE